MRPDWKGLLFPRASDCLICGDPRQAEEKYCLCPRCRESLLSLRLRENVCPRCMGVLDGKGQCHFCRADRLKPLRAGYGAFRYAAEAKTLVERLKYGFEDEAADALAAGMAQCFPAAEYDALVPVPLYRTRQRGRGANQAALLCDRVGPRAGLPVLDALRRVRNTRTQIHLSPSERQRNVRGAFSAVMDVQGLRLLLVDDVRTTGATTRACAAALLAAGAKYVSVLSATIATH